MGRALADRRPRFELGRRVFPAPGESGAASVTGRLTLLGVPCQPHGDGRRRSDRREARAARFRHRLRLGGARGLRSAERRRHSRKSTIVVGNSATSNVTRLSSNNQGVRKAVVMTNSPTAREFRSVQRIARRPSNPAVVTPQSALSSRAIKMLGPVSLKRRARR